MTSTSDMPNMNDIFQQNYLNQLNTENPNFTDNIQTFENLGFHLDHPKGQVVDAISDRNMTGQVPEFMTEMAQNTKDAGGKKIRFTIDEVKTERLKPLGLLDFVEKIDQDYEPVDVTEKNNHKKLMDVLSKEKISFLKFEDNGCGLDGDFKGIFSDNPSMTKNFKVGGAYGYYKTDGTRSKSGPSAGSHNTGGKTSIESASTIRTALETTRRASDDICLFGGHTRHSVLKLKGTQVSTSPRSMLYKENGDLINGKEANAMAEIFNARRKTGEHGFTAIVLEPKPEFKIFESLVLSALEAFRLFTGVYNFTITVTDNIEKKHIEINKSNFLQLVSHFTTQDVVDELVSRLPKGTIGYTKQIATKLREHTEEIFEIFSYARIPLSDYIEIGGVDPRKPELTQEQKNLMQESFESSKPIMFKSNIPVFQKVKDDNGYDVDVEESVSEMYTILIPSKSNKSAVFFDRDGIFISPSPFSFTKNFVSFSYFPRQGANKTSDIADLLRKCETINHDKWVSNQQVNSLYDKVPSTIEKVLTASREIIKEVFTEEGDSVDMSFFAQFFPGVPMESSNRKNESITYNIVKDDDDTQMEIPRIRGQKENISENKSSVVQNLLKITPKGYNEGFILEAAENISETFNLPEVNISLAFKELGIINNAKYSSTNIRKNYFIEGFDGADIEVVDNGNKLVLRNLPSKGFKIDIKNPDMMRVPELLVVIADNQQ